jgi:hypothetical protein
MIKKTFFENDARLNVIVNSRNTAFKMTDMFKILRNSSNVGIFTEEDELRGFDFLSGFTNVSVRDVMDVVSAYHSGMWGYNKRKGYELIASVESAKEIFKPLSSNSTQVGMFKEAGENLLKDLGNLSPSVKNRIFSPSGVSMSELHNGTYKDFLSVMRAGNKESEARLKPGQFVLPPESISRSDIRIKIIRKNTGNKFPVYGVSYSSIMNGYPAFSGSTDIVDDNYSSGMAEYEAKSEKGFALLYDSKKFNIPKKEIGKHLVSKKEVSFIQKKSYLWQVLFAFKDNFNVNFLCDSKKFLSEFANVDIEKMPLVSALDRLKKYYPGSEWEMRESGFIIFRGPQNPINKPRK